MSASLHLGEFLTRAAATWPDAPALAFSPGSAAPGRAPETYTFASLVAHCDAAAAFFEVASGASCSQGACGLDAKRTGAPGGGYRVCVIAEALPPSAIMQLACASSESLVYCPINGHYGTSRIASEMARCAPHAVVIAASRVVAMGGALSGDYMCYFPYIYFLF
jgi:acyl-CoA synthetase (AMP-forming)/AMP-acid ligase II